MTRTAIRGALAAGLILCAGSAAAQLNSDTVPSGRIVPLRESVEAQLEESRWRFGPFRVEPELKLTNLGYNDNVFGVAEGEAKVDDYTATVGLGLRSIAPIGSKTYFRIDAVPEYTWYQDLDERRQFGWEAGATLLGLFNRMSIEVGATTSDTVAVVNSEDPTPIPQTSDRARVKVEVEILRRLSLFAGFQRLTNEYEPEEGDVNYALLNRDETAQRVGLRYEFRPRFSLLAMVEQTEADFPDDETFTKNEGEAILAGFEYDRDEFFVNAVIGQRTIEYPGSGAPKFDELTGSIFVGWQIVRRTQLQLRASRRPQYSVFVDNPYFLESRQGARLVVPMGQRFLAFGGASTGKNEYQAPVIAGDILVERVDDLSSWEAGIGVRLFRSAVLTISTKADDYHSNLPGFDRKVVTTGMNLSFGGNSF